MECSLSIKLWQILFGNCVKTGTYWQTAFSGQALIYEGKMAYWNDARLSVRTSSNSWKTTGLARKHGGFDDFRFVDLGSVYDFELDSSA